MLEKVDLIIGHNGTPVAIATVLVAQKYQDINELQNYY